jgi:hypothetical protein
MSTGLKFLQCTRCLLDSLFPLRNCFLLGNIYQELLCMRSEWHWWIQRCNNTLQRKGRCTESLFEPQHPTCPQHRETALRLLTQRYNSSLQCRGHCKLQC